MKKRIHVVPHSHGWAIKVEGNSKASKLTDTKKEAQFIGIIKAKVLKTELVIHGKNGRIQDSDSYGNDPYPAKDRIH